MQIHFGHGCCWWIGETLMQLLLFCQWIISDLVLVETFKQELYCCCCRRCSLRRMWFFWFCFPSVSASL
jgi:hypothetical protein